MGCLLWIGAAAPAVAAGEGGGSIVEPTLGTLFWTLVTFLLLAVVLGRFAWKPLIRALDDRQRAIEGSLAEARREREEAGRLLEQQRALVAQAHRERAEAVVRGEKDAERLKAEILEEARRQREQLLRQTEEQVRAGIEQAKASLRATTADLAIRVAEKLLLKNLDEATHRRLVEEYLADLERSSVETGARPR